jgi:anti-sigma factor RsiW
MTADHHPPQHLTADDPRLSEWLDGRLPAAEAAVVERLVAASPELSRLVADLRRMKGSLAALPATPPPASFVGDVMAALDVPPAAESDEAEVEAEWRKIDRERRAQEIAAAGDDAAHASPQPIRRRWPWLALAGALAAGVLATVVINRPLDRAEREVALVTDPGKPLDAAHESSTIETNLDQAASLAEARAPESFRPGEKVMDGEGGGIGGGVPSGGLASDERAGRELAEAGKRVEAEQQKETLKRRAGDAAQVLGPGKGQGAVAASDAGEELAGRRQLGSGKPQGEADGVFAQPRLLTMRIRAPSDRERLAAVLAASGVEVVTGGPARKAAEDLVEDKASGAGRERIEVAGSPEAIAALIASLDAGQGKDKPLDRAATAAPAAKPGDARSAEARLQAGESESLAANGISPPVRLTIVVIDETSAPTAVAAPAAPPAADAPPSRERDGD